MRIVYSLYCPHDAGAILGSVFSLQQYVYIGKNVRVHKIIAFYRIYTLPVS